VCFYLQQIFQKEHSCKTWWVPGPTKLDISKFGPARKKMEDWMKRWRRKETGKHLPLGKTSAHRSFLFFCRKFSSAFATFLCIRQATSLISWNHHRSFSASDGEPGKQEGRMVPPTSQQEEFCPCVSLVDKTCLQYTHWHAARHSCGSEAYAQAQLCQNL
jgi:hypothetical protein